MTFSRERAIVLATATVSFGLAAVLRKLAIDRIPPLRYQVLSSIIYALTVPLFAMMATRYEKSSEPVDQIGLWWLIVATLVGMVGNLLFGYALRASGDVGVTTAISSAAPVVSIMISFFFLNERPSILTGFGCILVVAGVTLIGWSR
jgi:uncharacterized membrane protein